MSTDPTPSIFFFGNGQADGGDAVKPLVGGKGASLAEMTRAGLNVPPGFTISAACCELYHRHNRTWPADLEDHVRAALQRLEGLAGRVFGHGPDPLLVAVRSGAAQSMPGMMDTLLNVGLHPDCVRQLGEHAGGPRGAWRAYLHFLLMFAPTALGVPEAELTNLVADRLRSLGKPGEDDLDAAELESLCDAVRAHCAGQGRAVPTDPWAMLCAAVNAVFNSWENERAVTYRRHHKIEGLLGTAVTVQMMCPAEVAGVLFTTDPVNPAAGRMIVESSFGLGEAIVLGKVDPDRFFLDRKTFAVLDSVIGAKGKVTATVAPGGQAADRLRASLAPAQLADLGRLGLRVEQYFQMPCDVEWALAGGQFYLLQARAIKAARQPAADDSGELEQLRREEIAALRELAAPGGTVWARINLAEILPEPTPMTWAVVRQFMSGRGGYGQMYRDLGFDPDPALDEVGTFDLVCGRPYCNLSREPKLRYRTLPFEHPFAAYKQDPGRALNPRDVLNPARGGWRFFLLLPFTFFKLMRSAGRLQRASAEFADLFRKHTVPVYLAEADRAGAEDVTKLDNATLLLRFHFWVRRTLFEFGRDSLKPTLFTGLAQSNLELALTRGLQRQPGVTQAAAAARAGEVVRELVMGVHADAEADLPRGVLDLAAGRLSRADFLKRFGHRGSQEMELAQPRWAEDHAGLDRLTGQPGPPATAPADHSADLLGRIAIACKFTAGQQAAFAKELQTLQTYMGMREAAKHYLMRGYALVRRYLVELDRRYDLAGGIFFLTPDELPALVKGESAPGTLTGRIAQRRRRRALALRLFAPKVLFSDDLEALGREPAAAGGAGTLQGVGLSAGVVEGPALVLHEPALAAPPPEPYILVCPTTDPAWVPLFIHARGLVMETGGVLSHGAIVAREFGLPAVAGLPEIHRRVRSGQRLRIDGGRGTVSILA
jgi:pyruvate,water dikinase